MFRTTPIVVTTFYRFALSSSYYDKGEEEVTIGPTHPRKHPT
jgi:hypothetical protein